MLENRHAVSVPDSKCAAQCSAVPELFEEVGPEACALDLGAYLMVQRPRDLQQALRMHLCRKSMNDDRRPRTVYSRPIFWRIKACIASVIRGALGTMGDAGLAVGLRGCRYSPIDQSHRHTLEEPRRSD